MSEETKFMSYKKQLKLKPGDIVVLDGIEKPGKVTKVDLEDTDNPVQVEFYRDGNSTSYILWGHPPIIRRFPRKGELVRIMKKTERDSHSYEVGEEIKVIRLELDGEGGQELYCKRPSDGVTQWVYEAGVKRVKKGKAGV